MKIDDGVLLQLIIRLCGYALFGKPRGGLAVGTIRIMEGRITIHWDVFGLGSNGGGEGDWSVLPTHTLWTGWAGGGAGKMQKSVR